MSYPADMPVAPNNCPHCDNGPVFIHIWLNWGGGRYYFCKCSACGHEYTEIDDEEGEDNGEK